MLSVLALHAAAAYITLPIPDFLWAARDPDARPFFDALFTGLQGIGMAVFFWMSGLWAAQLYDRRGFGGFLKQRARTILVPFFAGAFLILPLVYYAWGFGWARQGLATRREIIVFEFHGAAAHGWLGPAHLWFLEYLVIYLLLFACARYFARPKTAARMSDGALYAGLVPAGLVLAADPGVLFDFHNTFVPMPFRFLYYGAFFWAGSLAGEGTWDRFRDRAWIHSLVGALAFAAFFHWVPAYFGGTLEGPAYPLFLLSELLFVWFALTGFVGLALRHFGRENRPVRLLAEASFTVYLVHFPVIGLVETLLVGSNLGLYFKFALVFTAGLSAGLAVFFLLVRRGPLGFLAGRRNPPVSGRLKIAAGLGLMLYISSLGFFQFWMHRALTQEYRRIVEGFYWKHFGHAPDLPGLEYWTTFAVDKWGLEKVEEVGFVEAKKHGAD